MTDLDCHEWVNITTIKLHCLNMVGEFGADAM